MTTNELIQTVKDNAKQRRIFISNIEITWPDWSRYRARPYDWEIDE